TTVDQIVAQSFGAGDISAESAKRLGEGADDHISLARQAATALAQNAGGMSIVDDEHGVMLAGEESDLGERCCIAVHGEHALGQDELRPVISLILTQKRIEMGGVAMAVAGLARA